MLENKSVTERELSLLAINQRKILTFIATAGGVQEPFGKFFLSQINLSSSSAARAMQMLLEKDYVHITKNNSEYRVLDPLMKSVLAREK